MTQVIVSQRPPNALTIPASIYSGKVTKLAKVKKNERIFPKKEDKCYCSLALFSGGCLLGGAGADDFAPGSLSSCFTASVGASGSFFTSTEIQKH